MIKRILVTATAIGMLAGAVTANAQTKVRLTLDWVPQSTHGPSFIARRFGRFIADLYRPVRIQYRTPQQLGLLERFHKTLQGYWDMHLTGHRKAWSTSISMIVK